ncbi:hypothetical protein ADJ73_16375 [Arsenicicoccus sp. oral taxon 190]|nr:hypothetical protein ADJ73_16375 [Arsenicicoccus sp. oral taxon 190]
MPSPSTYLSAPCSSIPHAVPRTRQSRRLRPPGVSSSTCDSRSNPACINANRARLSPAFSAWGSTQVKRVATRRIPRRLARRRIASWISRSSTSPRARAASAAATPAGRPDCKAYSTMAAAGVSTGASGSTSSVHVWERIRTREVEAPCAPGGSSPARRRVSRSRSRSRRSTGRPCQRHAETPDVTRRPSWAMWEARISSWWRTSGSRGTGPRA